MFSMLLHCFCPPFSEVFGFLGFFQKQAGKDAIEPMVMAHQTYISQGMT